jgi:hypothetical protein
MPTLLVVLKEIKKIVLSQRVSVKKNLEVNLLQREVVKYGICYAIAQLSNDHTFNNTRLFDILAQHWPKFSGSSVFPISVTGHGQSEFGFNGDKFGIHNITPYTRKRMELLNWCIKELEKESKPR